MFRILAVKSQGEEINNIYIYIYIDCMNTHIHMNTLY